ncbi:Increased rDNA silencing protein [Gryganskiella cystojenkinii]|nr:Increased rDNA silencing protein [Gryganskiella cystojenkinii]
MAQVLHAKALFECQGDEDSELSFLEGDILVNETSEEGWLHGRLQRTGEEGLFPDNYVELVSTPPVATPPVLPARSSPTPQTTPVTIAKQTLKSMETPKPVLPKNSQAATTPIIPILPSRPVQKTTLGPAPASPSIAGARAGLRSVEKPDGGPVLTGRVSPSQPTPSGVALPGLGSRSMYGGPSPSLPAAGRGANGSTSGPPPTLPKRSNTIHESTSSETNDGPALSVRERMANLSMANQRTASPGNPSNIAAQPVLPLRPAGGASLITPKPNPAARSPLSSAARPALPPRTLTENPSPLENRNVRSFASSVTAKPLQHPLQQQQPKSFQIQDAAAPAPKLTTFSRPRSARTSKVGSSGGSSPSLTESESKKSATITATPFHKSIPSEKLDSSVPPKLPSRAPSSAAATPATLGVSSISKSADPGPVRFSPVAIRSNNAASPSAAAANMALPTISRNTQPLPLPSRPGVAAASSHTLGSTRLATTGNNTAVDRNDTDNKGPFPSPFGVKLNSVTGSRPTADQNRGPTNSAPAVTTTIPSSDSAAPPPLPARSNTTATSTTSSTSSSSSTSSTRSTEDTLGRLQRSQILDRDRERVMDAIAGKSVPSWSTNNKTAVRPTPRATVSSAAGPVKGSCTQGSRVAMMLPTQELDMQPCEDVGIKKSARAKVHAIYVRSRLDSKTLAQIWDLVDVDNAGRLNRAQFCMGLYLIDERLSSGLIPLEVSDELWISVMM